MSATRRVDGLKTPATGISNIFAEALAVLAEVCGLIELDDLLSHLATSWCRLTGAQHAIVGVDAESSSELRFAKANKNGSSTKGSVAISRNANLLDELVTHAEVHITGREFESTCLVLRSDHTGQPIGGVILFGGNSLPDVLLVHLCRCSAALLIRTVSSDRLLNDAKLEALGEFAAGAGHEINNPLAAISGRAQMLLRDETDPEKRRHLLTIGAQALRVRDMIGDTMLFARPPLPDPQLLDLTVIVSQVQRQFVDECRSRHLTIGGVRSSECPIWADATQLCIVISELLRNAIQASPNGGRIELRTNRDTASDGRGRARLTVRDEGPGLSHEDREHLFDPFYSGRQAGRGLGFGLSKCWRIVTNHGGQIHLAPEHETGFAIIVDWPSSNAVPLSTEQTDSVRGND